MCQTGVRPVVRDQDTPDRRSGEKVFGSSNKRNRSRPPDKPFDLWLRRQLHAAFDDVEDLPLPEELLDVLREKPRPAPAASKGGNG